MKKILLLDGGVRHIAAFYGAVYLVLSAMLLLLSQWNLGLLREFFVLPGYERFLAAFLPIFFIAIAIEMYVDYKNGTYNKIGGSIYSWSDVFCYTFGGYLGLIIFNILGQSVVMTLVSIILIALSIYDYKSKYLQTKFNKK